MTLRSLTRPIKRVSHSDGSGTQVSQAGQHSGYGYCGPRFKSNAQHKRLFIFISENYTIFVIGL